MVSQQQEGLALLYVEDEPETREMMSDVLALRFPGVRLHTAVNGAEGLEAFTRLKPQLVVTDISMPVMDGLQMASQIRDMDTEVELIALTAYNDQDFLKQAAEIGFTDYLLKPIDYKALFAAIERSLARKVGR
jgi:two-component system, sensor histidine kinase and response regulator